MGRMHSQGKGISGSALPFKRTPPSWLKTSSVDASELICKLARKGLLPSQIGVILRDQHGVGQIKNVTGNKVVRILKANGLGAQIPEDLYHLIKKALNIRRGTRPGSAAQRMTAAPMPPQDGLSAAAASPPRPATGTRRGPPARCAAARRGPGG